MKRKTTICEHTHTYFMGEMNENTQKHHTREKKAYKQTQILLSKYG